MTAYYNENDPFAAANLVAQAFIETVMEYAP